MAITIKISDAARDVLARSEITATHVKLPEQLDRALYVAVNKALVAAGGKWNRKAGVHMFERDPRTALGLVVETGVAVREKQDRQAFYTPAWLADRMANRAYLKPGHRLLEPSCGMGALVDAALRAQPEIASITAYDIDPVAACVGDKDHCCVEIRDFLTVPVPLMPYDRILMNPPFTKGQAVQHVHRAIVMLGAYGYLVAIMPPAWRTSSRRVDEAFRDLLEHYETDIEEIEAGAFKDAGTMIRTVMLVVRRTPTADGP